MTTPVVIALGAPWATTGGLAVVVGVVDPELLAEVELEPPMMAVGVAGRGPP